MKSLKKIFIYLIIIMVVFFILPAVFTKNRVKNSANKNTLNETSKIQNEENVVNDYDYTKFATIKLYHKESDSIEEIPIDEYLYGVVSAEMPVNYELEALKAQAIVARTYTLYQIINSGNKHEGADICDNSNCCQAWISKEGRLARWESDKGEENWNKIVQAVDGTKGKIITYNNEPIDAFFHANSGGKTETASNVWGGKDLPYLQSVETSGEERIFRI